MSALAFQAPANPRAEPAGGILEYVSASRLRLFQECRLKFFFRYVARIPVPTPPSLFVGQMVHQVLQQWNLRRWRGEPADVKALWPVFNHHWVQDQPAEGIDWQEQESEKREQAWSLLEHYFENTPIPLDEKPEAVEVRVERDFLAAGLPSLVGIIDLVRSNGRIVDFKTTARTPDRVMAVHQNEIQLSCYAVLYREATSHPETGLELHHLVKTKQPRLIVTPLSPMTPVQGQRLMRIMESYVAGVQAGDYIPSPGLQCAWCEYLEDCRRWKPA